MCLLICTHRLLAAEEGWEQSTSSGDSPWLPPAPTKAPVGWGHGHSPAAACRADGALLFPEKTLASYLV